MVIEPPRLAVLVSGRGSNLQAMIDAQQAGSLGAVIAVVISNRPDAQALQRAAAAGIPAVYIEGSGTPSFEQQLLAVLAQHRIDLIALAGFMRLLGPEVVSAYRWRVVNIHPSLLPAFAGLHAVRRALEHGLRVTGCTVHFVDEGMDTGPIIFQEAVPILPDDDEASLTARIQAVEHRLYPQAIRLLAEGRLRIVNRHVQIDPETKSRRTALISVSDKRGLVEFAAQLHRAGWRIVATGGTAETLQAAGIKTEPVETVTGFPEILDGRVKTLHPAIHAGLLARRDDEVHLQTLRTHRFHTIDLVCVNLYPFEQAARQAAAPSALLEQIDIGGPTLIRAAAKNFAHVIPVVDPDDYPTITQALAAQGDAPASLRSRLAVKAFAHTAFYDATINSHLRQTLAGDGPAISDPEAASEQWPERMVVPLVKVQSLRYGENPHQRAALYAEVLHEGYGLPGAKQLQGKELSYNNLLDAAAAWSAVCDFEQPAVVAVKHNNPCGIAVGDNLRSAFQRVQEADPVSIFGGIVACNRPLDAAAAEAMVELFLEVILAPDVSAAAAAVLARRPSLRVLTVPSDPDGGGQLGGAGLRSVPGGLLIQTLDRSPAGAAELPENWRTVAGQVPVALLADLEFAWMAVKHVRSNAIVVARDGMTIGIGAGQMNRVQAAQIALAQAGERAAGAVLASDAFFPFPDTVELCAQAGIAAIIQPGGSVRDEAVIAAAAEAGISMVFTGVRHFRH